MALNLGHECLLAGTARSQGLLSLRDGGGSGRGGGGSACMCKLELETKCRSQQLGGLSASLELADGLLSLDREARRIGLALVQGMLGVLLEPDGRRVREGGQPQLCL